MRYGFVARCQASVLSLAAVLTASACAPVEGPAAAALDRSISSCRGMKDLNGIPPGWHPVTVRWEPGSTFGDTVCIAQTRGRQISFIAWMDAPLPSGYYVLSSDDRLDPTFAGCREWTVWQGNAQCSRSWSRYTLQQNP